MHAIAQANDASNGQGASNGAGGCGYVRVSRLGQRGKGRTTMPVSSLSLVRVATIGGALALAAAQVQGFPERPITLLVP